VSALDRLAALVANADTLSSTERDSSRDDFLIDENGGESSIAPDSAWSRVQHQQLSNEAWVREVTNTALTDRLLLLFPAWFVKNLGAHCQAQKTRSNQTIIAAASMWDACQTHVSEQRQKLMDAEAYIEELTGQVEVCLAIVKRVVLCALLHLFVVVVVLVVGCWLLVVGCWLLVVGCWLLVDFQGLVCVIGMHACDVCCRNIQFVMSGMNRN
jgi:hypothetical protein